MEHILHLLMEPLLVGGIVMLLLRRRGYLIPAKELKELRQKEIFFKAIIEYSTDFVFQVISKDVVQYVNGPSEEILGLTTSQILQQSWTKFIHEDDQELFQSFFCIAEENPDKMFVINCIRMKHRDNKPSYCEGRIVYSSELKSFIANWRHITERVLALEELLRTKHDLEQALQLVTEGVKAQTKIITGGCDAESGDCGTTESH